MNVTERRSIRRELFLPRRKWDTLPVRHVTLTTIERPQAMPILTMFRVIQWPLIPPSPLGYLYFLSLLVLAIGSGCQRGPEIVPVEGVVKFEGQPLRYGTVHFQPLKGQPAIGHIQPDGSFRMTTFKLNDGATVGMNKVKITAFQSQDPSNPPAVGEQSLGKSMIPERYNLADQSGLTADVKPSDNPPFVFELKK